MAPPPQRTSKLTVRPSEARDGEGADAVHGEIEIHRGLIGAVGGDGIEGIGHGDDARHQRNLIGCKAVGVAGAVEAFVMQFDAGQHFFQLGDGTHDVGAFHRVLLHEVEFFVGELAGLFEDAVIHPDFSHVVQQRGDAQAVEIF
jgi:hypothetical protein